MKKRIRQPFLSAALLMAFALSAAGQATIDINFQGLLTDGSGDLIADESFDFEVKLMTADAAKAELFAQQSSLQTDSEGWMSFSIPSISDYLLVGEDIRENLVIQMEFKPNEHTSWLRPGDEFMVSYTLSPTLRDGSIYLKMTRMEGSELSRHLDENLYVFKDEYPFAYLTGGFLLTDAPPLSSESHDNLRAWILPDPAEDGNATRGVKSGFPKGGYKKSVSPDSNYQKKDGFPKGKPIKQ